MTHHLFTGVPHFNVDDLLPILHCPGQLRINALSDQDKLNERKVCQMRPADACEDAELVSIETRHEPK